MSSLMSNLGTSFNRVKENVAFAALAACVCCVLMASSACFGSGSCLATAPDAASIHEAVTQQSGTPVLTPAEVAPAPGTSGAAPHPAQKVKRDSWESTIELTEVLARVRTILPNSWEVSAIQYRQIPRRWSGSADGILIRLENPSIVAYHPNGFEYHPFFKVWLCPTLWRGTMEDVRFLEEADWSVLLGQNHKMKVFYLTQGLNDWQEGPKLLREALDLTSIPITRSLRQKIEPEIMMKIFPKLAVMGNGQSGLLDRVVGLEIEGPLAYVEYATATVSTAGGGGTGAGNQPSSAGNQPAGAETVRNGAVSRCAEPGVVWLMDRENLSLANLIMLAYPEVETVYLRRVCDEFASDHIIDRSDVTSKEPVVLSNSSE